MRALLAVLGICLSVTGCVTTTTFRMNADVSPPDDESAKVAIKKQDWPTAVLHIDSGLRSTVAGTPERTRALFGEYPELKDIVLRQVTDEARTQVQVSVALTFTQKHVAMVRGLDLYTATEKDALDRTFIDALTAVIDSDVTAFDISDIRSNSEVFGREPLKERLVSRALRRAINSDEPNQRTQLLEFYQTEAADSPYRKRIVDALPTLAFTANELRGGTVASLFPDFARQRLTSATVEVALITEPSRRLLEEDLIPRLMVHAPTLSVVRRKGPQTKFEIVVRELELKETRARVNQETRVVPPHEIDFLTAVFALPAGASLLYDVRHGGLRIEYAYEVVIRVDGKETEDKLFRDRVGHEYYQCSNLRYRTMGGQVRAFDIAPNTNVVAWCRSGGTPVDESMLRNQVLDALASGLSGMQAITATAPARSAPDAVRHAYNIAYDECSKSSWTSIPGGRARCQRIVDACYADKPPSAESLNSCVSSRGR